MGTGGFGSKLKEIRIRQGITLRQFCAAHGFDPGNYSRIERGLFAPPHTEKIEEYARALGVEIGSDEYVELLDLATVDRGELPRELLNDAQVVKELPILFRSLRGDPVPPDKLDRLVELIRRR